jgi:hypothetical protein
MNDRAIRFMRASTRFARSGMVRLGRLMAPAHHDTMGFGLGRVVRY